MPAAIHHPDPLAEYKQSRSPQLLSQLIEQHIDFVYAAAYRQLRDSSLAEDVTQAVFIILTRKAGSIRPSSLVGWLYNTTRYCAKNARRGELRHRRHEQQAARREASMPTDFPSSDQPITDLRDKLDDGLASLRGGDREVVLLRYLQGREFSDVSATLGISEQAARKRLNRAVHRLRRFFAESGADIAPAMIVTTLESAGRHAPPHLLQATLLATTTTAKTSAGFIAAKTIHLMFWTQMKFAAAILLATLAASAAATVVVHRALLTTPITTPASADPVSPATPPVATVPFTAQFADGMKVELLGMNVNPAGNNPWWLPDGSPLARAAYRTSYGRVSAGLGDSPFEFGVRLTGQPRGSDANLDPLRPTSISSWDGSSPHVTAIATLFAPDEPATIRFRYATGPWKKAISAEAKAIFTTGVTVEGVSFSPASNSKDPASITIVNGNAADFLKQDWDVVALDGRNIVHTPTNVQSNNNLLIQTTTVSFQHLKREDVTEYQIATRPYDRWVEFRNVSTQPGVLTDVEVVTSESPEKK